MVFKKSALLGCALTILMAGSAAHGMIEVQELTGGLDAPVGVTHAGDGSGRLFIVSQRGSIYIWDGSQVLGTPYLDIEGRVDFGGEQGLLGLAFHPDYENNGRFFVHYSDTTGGDTVLSEFVVSGSNPDRADANSEVVLFTTNQPFSNHNGGQLAFGPDGFLYLGLGDGGSANDPGNRGQDLDEWLGKLLRFDIDIPAPYVPASNPFVGVPNAKDEIWAYGLRNPWRFSFDRDTGDMFIADVGQNNLEEIDFQPAGSAGGENYGWRLMEGTDCFNPPANCNDGSLVLPIMEYEHFDGGFQGCSVTGGYRYRGSDYAELSGLFFFADFCTGKIWAGEEQGGGNWTFDELLDTSIGVTSFGEDENGEIYLVGDSELYQLVGTGGSLVCGIDTNQAVYSPGDALIASTLDVQNLGDNSEAVRVQLGVIRPSAPPIIVYDEGGDGSIVVGGGAVLDLAPLTVGTIPGAVPAGSYALGCRLSDPVTGDIINQTSAPFEISTD